MNKNLVELIISSQVSTNIVFYFKDDFVTQIFSMTDPVHTVVFINGWFPEKLRPDSDIHLFVAASDFPVQQNNIIRACLIT